MEYFELLDEKGGKLGRVKERNAVHRDGDLHGGSHVWVVRLERETGGWNDGSCPGQNEGERIRVEVLLQRRRMDKDSFPGCLDVSCAGHMTAGEDFLSTALRELEEELGIRAQASDLWFLHDQLVGGEYEFHGKPFRNYEVNHVYLLRTDFPLDAMHYQEEEISGLVWQEIGRIREALRAGSREYCIHLEELERLWDFFFRSR